MCEVEGCEKPINKGGVCLRHKLLTVSANTGWIKREREGVDATGGMGSRAYAEDVYKKARERGREDPEPMNKHAARYAPKKGVLR